VAEAIALLEEAVVLRRKHLASPMVALALNHLAAAHIADGGADSLEHAARALSEADAIVTAAHDRWQIGAIMITRGKLALRRGDAAGARAMFERALGVLAYQHAHIESGRALEALADLERAAGDLDAWRERLIMAQLVYLERGHTHLAQAIDVRLAASRV
jgi:tetratricopeptide (TPR) repeat protein